MENYTPVRLSFTSFDPEDFPTEMKAPVIFLHGMNFCKEVWRSIPQLVANETKRKAYTYDARNHGDSEWSDEFTIEIMVRDLFHFMDTINATTAILIGHSMGGTIAINAALMEPERVEMLIVEDMSVRKPPQRLLGFSVFFTMMAPKAVALIPKGVDETEAIRFVINFIEQNFTLDKTKRMNSVLELLLSRALRKSPDGRFELKANMSVLEKALKVDTKTHLIHQGCYSGPTCFIYGKQSPFQVLEDSQNIEKHFPEVVFVGIENATHSVHIDNPHEFLRAVVEFVADHEVTLIGAEGQSEMNNAAQSPTRTTQNIKGKEA